MGANNGKGKALFKNEILLSDTLHGNGIHAVRHANGRDWWLITAKLFSNKYFLLLLSPNGVGITEQQIGEVAWSEAGGEIVFSPDGTKLACFNTRDDLRLFDFDRCSGTLSNPQHIVIQDNTEDEISAGLAFSADGRYLYAAEVKRLLQFDLWASDIAASMVEIAVWESNPDCPLGRSIGFLELGPDGRIYCRPVSGQSCMHRVSRPELPGSDCEYVHHFYKFDFAYNGLPHFPNFRLGPIDNSPCDTLGLNNQPLANWRYDKTGLLDVDFTSVSWYELMLWQWDFGDPASGSNNNSLEKHPAHTFSGAGAYEVCLTVSNPYGNDTKCKMVWVGTSSTGSGGGESMEVVLFPNPTKGMVQWSGLPEGETVNIQVFNPLGQIQMDKVTTDKYLDLNHLPQGLYFVKIFSAAHQVLFTGSISLLK